MYTCPHCQRKYEVPPKWCPCTAYPYDPAGPEPQWYLIGEESGSREPVITPAAGYWQERMGRSFDAKDWNEVSDGPLPPYLLAMEEVQDGIEVEVSVAWSFYRLGKEDYTALREEFVNTSK